MSQETPASTAIEQTPAHDDIYRYMRSEIQFEINLINARVNWLIASQAFLFVPLTIGAQGLSISRSVLFPLIPWLGLLLCALVSIAILAAVWRSRQWRAKCAHGPYSGDGQEGRFSIVLPRTPLIPVMGLIGALGVPAALAGAWLALLLWPPGAPGSCSP